VKPNLNRVLTGVRLELFLTSPLSERKKITNSCLRKSRYETIQEAKKVADYYKDKENLTLRIYKCKPCGGYHLTKKAKKWSNFDIRQALKDK